MKILSNKIVTLSLLSLMAGNGISQVIQDSLNTVPVPPVPVNTTSENPLSWNVNNRKGKMFFYWGYNRSAYTKSDIHFWGDGYDFTIEDVVAKDDPTTSFITYIKPNSFTVPEYNYRIGYYISDKNFISLGEDHMKYSIERQGARLTGTVGIGENAGTYNGRQVLIGENSAGHTHTGSSKNKNHKHSDPSLDSLPKGFVSVFEHCDGLNDISFEFGRVEKIWSSERGKSALTVVGTIASGLVIPDTDAGVLGQKSFHNLQKKTYHLAGYSFSGSIGFQFDFCKSFFLQTRLKGGYINLLDINTSIYKGKANQHFGFIEPMLVVGYSRSFGKH